MKERKDIESQIENERKEHERDFSNLSKIEKCPKCGGEFDEGYIIMRASVWSEDRFPLTYLGLKEPLTNPGIINPSQFPALRCMKCHFVTFD